MAPGWGWAEAVGPPGGVAVGKWGPQSSREMEGGAKWTGGTCRVGPWGLTDPLLPPPLAPLQCTFRLPASPRSQPGFLLPSVEICPREWI